MIDLQNEHPLSLDAVRTHRLLVHRNGGRGIAFSTVWKWTKQGYGGTKLETYRSGGALATTEEALIRFLQAISKQPTEQLPNAATAAHLHADKMLAAAGI